MSLSKETILELEKIKCEHCNISLSDYYDLENNPEDIPDCVPAHWYCSEYCYKQDDN